MHNSTLSSAMTTDLQLKAMQDRRLLVAWERTQTLRPRRRRPTDAR